MAIITQTDKRSGITYAYETQYYWDKENKQSRFKRECIGKVNPVTGKIVPTSGRVKKGESKKTTSVLKKQDQFHSLKQSDCIMEPPIFWKHSQMR